MDIWKEFDKSGWKIVRVEDYMGNEENKTKHLVDKIKTEQRRVKNG